MAEQAATSFVEDIQGQFQSFFQNLSVGKKIFLFSSIAVVLLGLVAFVYFSQQVTWTTLISGVDQQDAARIIQKLDEINVQYMLQPGGTAILVPAAEVDRVRLQIASAGLQMGGVVGLEIFDKNNFGATEFQQKIQYKRALEGELSRLISRIDIIESAKLSIAIPEKSLFIDQEKRPTASVMVELAGSKRMSQKGINTILNLVSGAIPGMQLEDVRIADQSGKLLSKGMNETGVTDSRDKNYTYQQIAEQRLEQKVITQLESVVGKDRVRVRVSLQMNFNSSEIIEDLVDPDGSAILSEEVNTEEATGSRSIPVGVPGVTSNSPEVRAGASEIANVSDRRSFSLLTPELNNGLPSMLIRGNGLNTGLMVAQYVGAALVSDNKTLAHPDSVDSIPSSANQEDHVSMGANGARHLWEIIENVTYVVAIELLCAAQGIDLRENGSEKLGVGTAAAYRIVRTKVKKYDNDHEMSPDINTLVKLMQSNAIIDAVEKEIEHL